MAQTDRAGHTKLSASNNVSPHVHDPRRRHWLPQAHQQSTAVLNCRKKTADKQRFGIMCCESANKPGSVLCCQSDNHSSRTYVAIRLKQPTRPQRGPRQRGPIWSCSGWSLPCHELLPAARCALTAPFHPYLIPLAWAIGGLLSVALVVGSRPPGVTWHPAL